MWLCIPTLCIFMLKLISSQRLGSFCLLCIKQLSRSSSGLFSIYTTFNLRSFLEPSHMSNFLGNINCVSSVSILILLYRNSFEQTERVNVSGNRKMILNAAIWSLPILIFWWNNSSMICQVWLNCLQTRLSSSNKMTLSNEHSLRTMFTHWQTSRASFVQPLTFLLRYNPGLHPCQCFFFFFLCNFYFYLRNLKWIILFATWDGAFCVQ